jgi:hypothetical protein
MQVFGLEKPTTNTDPSTDSPTTKFKQQNADITTTKNITPARPDNHHTTPPDNTQQPQKLKSKLLEKNGFHRGDLWQSNFYSLTSSSIT